MNQQQQHYYVQSQQMEDQQQQSDHQLQRNSFNHPPIHDKTKERDISNNSSQSSSITRKENYNQFVKRNNEMIKSRSREGRENHLNQNILKLSNQNIKVISGINHYINIQEIDLSHNQIIKIQNIDRLIMITTLNLSHNKIAIIENLSELLNLQNLNISHNQIKVFPKLLTKNHNIRTLTLSHNQIENEDCFNFLNKFIHLKNLDLSENPISKQQHYQQSVTNAISTLTHLDGVQLNTQQQFSLNSYFDNKENMKNLLYTTPYPIMNDQEDFKKILKNHDKNQSSLGFNLAQMINDMASTNSQYANQQNAGNIGTQNTIHLGLSSQINKGSTQNLSREFQSIKRVPFKEIKQSDQKSDSFSYQYLSNGHLTGLNYNAKYDSNIKVNNFLSSQTQDNIVLDANSNTQFTDIIQLSQQHSPRDEINHNQKREELVNAKLQKSEEMKNQCIGYLEKWDMNLGVFHEQLNLLFLQNQLFKEWVQSTMNCDAIKALDILTNSTFQELIEKVHSLITLTTQVASLMKRQKTIKRLEKFLKQSFHPQEITKKVIELLEMPKRSQEYDELILVQRNCEQIILVIHNMKLKLLKESQKEQKSTSLINQIFKNIIDQNNLYINVKKTAESGKLLSQSVFSKFLLFFKYHIKDSSESIACIQGDLDLNESLRDLLFSNDDNQIQKYILPYENQTKSTQKNIHNQTPILQELDAYLHNIMDEDFITSKQRLSNTAGNNTTSLSSQSADVIINSFHHSCSKKDQKDFFENNLQNNSIKKKKECTRCQEANQVMLQQQNKIEELSREIHSSNQRLQDKEEQINSIKIQHQNELNELELKYREFKRLDEENYDKLKHSLINEEDLFHHLNDQMAQQDIIIEQNKEIGQRLSEYNNYMVRLMQSKNDDATEFFKIILTQQAKSIEQMITSNKSNSQLYANLLRVVENNTLPQMKLIPKSDASSQTNNRISNQFDQNTTTTFATSPSKGRDIFQSLENNSITKRNKAKQMINVTPPSYFNGTLTSRKSTPTLDFQKEMQKKKKHSKNLENQSIQQSQLDLERIYISPQRDYNDEDEGQKNLYTFSQRNPSSVEKEVIASFYNPNKHQYNEEFSLISYNNHTFSHKKSPICKDKEISFFNRSNNSKQNGCNAFTFTRSPWKTTQDSKKKDISCGEESQITEIERDDEEDSQNKRGYQQPSTNGNFKNFFEKRDDDNEQDFQLGQHLNHFNRKNGQQFGEVQQFDPFVGQAKPNQQTYSDNNKNNFSQATPNNEGNKSTRNSDARDKTTFSFNNNLQQKIVSALQKKGLDQQKAKATINKNMENYKKQKKLKPQNSTNNLVNSNSTERIPNHLTNNMSNQQLNSSKTPKKKLNIDLNINLSGNLSNFQSKSTTHQSNSQSKYFSYNCATTKNSQQLYQNQQKQMQQQSNERKNFTESSERHNYSQCLQSASLRNSNNTSKDERLKQQQYNGQRNNSSQSSSQLDLNTYKVSNNQKKSVNESYNNQSSRFSLNDQNNSRQNCMLTISGNHTNDNCDSLFHKRIIQQNAESSINNSKISNKSTNINKSLINNTNSSQFNNSIINGIHANYFSQQNIYKNTQKQPELESEIINSYQLNQIKEKRYPSNSNQPTKQVISNTYSSIQNMGESHQFNEKRPSFFENTNNHSTNYNHQQYNIYKQTNN